MHYFPNYFRTASQYINRRDCYDNFLIIHVAQSAVDGGRKCYIKI